MKKLTTGIAFALATSVTFAQVDANTVFQPAYVSAYVLSVQQDREIGWATLEANTLPPECTQKFYLYNEQIGNVLLAAFVSDSFVRVRVGQAWPSYESLSNGALYAPTCFVTDATISRASPQTQ